MLYDKEKWDKQVVQPDLKPWQKVLLDAADLIRNRGWGVGQFWLPVGAPPGHRYHLCAVGAIRSVEGSRWDKFVARHKLRFHIRKVCIMVWNDGCYSSTYVIDALKKAARQ